MENKTEYQAGVFFNRLVKTHRHLRKWAARTGAGVYRLYDRDVPEIPLALDFYQNDETRALSGALYERPYYKDPGEEESWLCAMKAAAAEALEIDGRNIFLKIRKRRRRKFLHGENTSDQYQKEEGGSFKMIIKENGLSFIVNLSDYIDAGIFPDLRNLRKMVMEEASGKAVLNLFCYTGAFSVYAARGGARRVDSVDMSSTYLKWAAANCELNGVKMNPVRADVFRFLEDAAFLKKRWDIIIVDPPAFSNSKKMKGDALGGVFDIKRDYQFLLSKCLPLLSAGGKIFFCVNARKFSGCKFDLRGAARDAEIRVKEISERLRGEDFKGRRTPRCFEIREIN
ncbi:MAG: class I SAM-dependent methyltransferase [Spirochaetaceae bacterium]|jgi:23S rRNA G2069 N7-methylase RlmK/C1962 C5-methylase RlmI|nr:class I SAM-dependent methyltransferase [Spirochaetaceae bacterium]